VRGRGVDALGGDAFGDGFELAADGGEGGEGGREGWGVEKKAVVRTINSVYEVTALPNSDYVEKVIGQESLAQQREADKNDGGDSL
jgi:hypothetical protein